MRKLAYLVGWLMVASLSSAALAQTVLSSKDTLRDFLRGTTWCFADTSGPRQMGRIYFKANGTGFYNVVDAPGPGGITLTWKTFDHGVSSAILVQFASGMTPRKQWADVAIFSEDEMMWSYFTTDGSISTLNRCR